MKRTIVIAITGMALTASLVAGCGRASPSPTSAAAVNPSPQSLPPDTQNTGEATSDVLQSGVPLTIADPADAATLDTDTVDVKGQTVPAATLSVNDVAGVADANGNFSVPISLGEGLNAVDVIATDDSGKVGEALIMVNVVSSGVSATPTSQAGSGAPGSIPLTVTQPADAATLNADTVDVEGQTTPGATVLVNDQIGAADADGNFSITVPLVSGANAIDVRSQDSDGNDNEVIVMVKAP